MRHPFDARCAVAGDSYDLMRRTAVPRRSAVEDVTQPVPVRRALHRHHDHVVCRPETMGERPRRTVVGERHRVDRVEAAQPSVLWTARAVLDRQRQRVTRPDRLHRRPSFGVVDEVQRPQDVTLAPAPPIADALGCRDHRVLHGHALADHLPSSFTDLVLLLSASCRREPGLTPLSCHSGRVGGVAAHVDAAIPSPPQHVAHRDGQRANVVDRQCHRLAVLERTETLVIGAAGDHVAVTESDASGGPRDQLGHAVLHVVGVVVVAQLSVVPEPDVQVVGIVDLIGGDDPRPDRAEGVKRLPQPTELAPARPSLPPRRDVDQAGVAEHRGAPAGFADRFGGL